MYTHLLLNNYLLHKKKIFSLSSVALHIHDTKINKIFSVLAVNISDQKNHPHSFFNHLLYYNTFYRHFQLFLLFIFHFFRYFVQIICNFLDFFYCSGKKHTFLPLLLVVLYIFYISIAFFFRYCPGVIPYSRLKD